LTKSENEFKIQFENDLKKLDLEKEKEKSLFSFPPS
jgi:hypothetical protein